MIKWAKLHYADRVSAKLGKDIDGDIFTYKGKKYYIDILHNVVSYCENGMYYDAYRKHKILTDIFCFIISYRKNIDPYGCEVVEIFKTRVLVNLNHWAIKICPRKRKEEIKK